MGLTIFIFQGALRKRSVLQKRARTHKNTCYTRNGPHDGKNKGRLSYYFGGTDHGSSVVSIFSFEVTDPAVVLGHCTIKENSGDRYLRSLLLAPQQISSNNRPNRQALATS